MGTSEYINKIISDYLNPIFSFVLKRTRTIQEAEDVTQEIMMKIYKALNNGEDIYNVDGYIWRIAHNTMANYYRGKSKAFVEVSIDDMDETIKDGQIGIEENYIKNEEINRLKDKIAYLSKLQRQVVILYYYEGKQQEEISQLLGIPKGTVKWHLFEARKELKKGMERMNNKILELKFNPIKFSSMGLNGSVGREGGTSHFFKSTLSQNIVYAIYHKERTINEIADLLGVSPVYIESEVEYLEEYSFLMKLSGNRYISNMIIDEVIDDYLDLVDKMYRRASEIIANEVFDKIINSELLSSEGIYYPDQDKNFLMWTLVPFILAFSENGEDRMIKFEDVATVRKDGGCYIANASIDNPFLKNKQILEDRENWYGPLWNQYDNTILWQINSKWCNREINIETYSDTSQYEIRLLNRYVSQHDLSSEEFSYLAEKGYIKGSIGQDQLNIVWLKDKSIKSKFLEIGSNIKLRHKDELNTIKSEYIKTVLGHTPKHLRKVRAFELQDIFSCNGIFLLYSLRALLSSSRLKEIEDEYQKKTLKTLLITNS